LAEEDDSPDVLALRAALLVVWARARLRVDVDDIAAAVGLRRHEPPRTRHVLDVLPLAGDERKAPLFPCVHLIILLIGYILVKDRLPG